VYLGFDFKVEAVCDGELVVGNLLMSKSVLTEEERRISSCRSDC